jgi:hypothetical protein
MRRPRCRQSTTGRSGSITLDHSAVRSADSPRGRIDIGVSNARREQAAAVADLDHDGVDEHRHVDPSKGRLAHSCISATTVSVIRETVSFDTEAP